MGKQLMQEIDIKSELLRYGILPRAKKAKKPSNKANYYVNTICAFDIETTNKDDEECIVYSTMIMKTDSDVCYHNSSVEDLVDNLENLPTVKSIIYAHNGGKFDYKCILGEFLKRGYTIKEKELEESYIQEYKKAKVSFLKNSDEKIINVLYKDNKFYKIEINMDSIVTERYKRRNMNAKNNIKKKKKYDFYT